MNLRAGLLVLSAMIAASIWATGAARSSEKKVTIVTNYSESDSDAARRIKRFTETLDKVTSKNHTVVYSYYWADGNVELIKHYASIAVAAKPDAIFAATTPVVAALLSETRTIPIVFASVSDPVGSGFVESLARPDKNATGFITTEGSLASKWVQYLKELLPELPCISMMFNPETAPYSRYYLGPFEDASIKLNISSMISPVHTKQDIEDLISLLSARRCGLVLMNDSFIYVHRREIDKLSHQYNVPIVSYNRRAGMQEAVISYGPDEIDAYGRAADYVKRILDGSRVESLPVQLNSKFYPTLNLRRAKELGIGVPDRFLSQVDEEFE